jgi:hypothetical protein
LKTNETKSSGQVDRDEFKIAIFTCGPFFLKSCWLCPDGLLTPTPLDAFKTFDENGIGHLNEDEFFFGIQLSNKKYQTLFHSTECIDYEFREAFFSVVIWGKSSNLVGLFLLISPPRRI